MKVLVNLSGENSKWLSRARTLGLAIKPILEALVTVDQIYLRSHKVPPLYRSGVRYQNEPVNTAHLGGVDRTHRIEEFAAIPAVIERGWGDCDDLAPWRVAELREHGERAKIRVYWKRQSNGHRLYHVVVRRADGTIEDPSAKLGMRG